VTPTELATIARGALQNLEANRQRIDDLNVYPVPDGDTGSNLVLTLRRIVETIEESSAATPSELADEVFHVALRAGKGNSGVIFSQIVRGFAKRLGAAESVTATALATAFRAGSDAGYLAVSHVGAVEGTILTVIREMAEEAEDAASRQVSATDVLVRVLARGEDALARTPELLDVLGRAGVVDAGGAGLVEIVRGAALAANGEPIPAAPVVSEKLASDAVHQERSRFRYCTGFVVEGEALDAVAFEEALGRLGDSLLVVGDESALKVHVHTDDPGAALSTATAIGVIDEVEIADMHAQTAAREARLRAAEAAQPAVETGVVAVVQGEGNRAIFEAEKAKVVEAGQGANPSVGEIADAIAATRADAVIVLPNNSNAILAATKAAELAEKDVRVVPSRSVQAGLAAIIAFVSTNSVDENEERMLEALRGVATGEVTVASRDVEIDGVGVREGAYLGLVDGVAVSCQDAFVDAASSVVDRVLDGERTHLDIIVGDGAPAVHELVAGIRRTHPDLEVEVYEGGQPHYPLLVVAE
jgi:DAK2 domain fusion protein YloV